MDWIGYGLDWFGLDLRLDLDFEKNGSATGKVTTFN